MTPPTRYVVTPDMAFPYEAVVGVLGPHRYKIAVEYHSLEPVLVEGWELAQHIRCGKSVTSIWRTRSGEYAALHHVGGEEHPWLLYGDAFRHAVGLSKAIVASREANGYECDEDAGEAFEKARIRWPFMMSNALVLR